MTTDEKPNPPMPVSGCLAMSSFSAEAVTPGRSVSSKTDKASFGYALPPAA